MSTYRPSREQRDYDARQLDLRGHETRPRRIVENVMTGDGRMVEKTRTVYPEDYLYDPIGKK